MPAGDTYRCSQQFLMANNAMQIDMWLRDTAGAGFAPMATSVDTHLGANLAPLQSVDCLYNGVRIGDPIQRVLAGQVFPNTTVAGTVNSPATPPTTSVVITLNTGRYGRGKQGRLFVPGLPEGVQLDGRLPPADTANWQTAFDAINAGFNTDGFEWVVAILHRPVTHPPTYDGVVGVVLLTARNILRVQKRREVGRSIRHR